MFRDAGELIIHRGEDNHIIRHLTSIEMYKAFHNFSFMSVCSCKIQLQTDMKEKLCYKISFNDYL